MEALNLLAAKGRFAAADIAGAAVLVIFIIIYPGKQPTQGKYKVPKTLFRFRFPTRTLQPLPDARPTPAALIGETPRK